MGFVTGQVVTIRHTLGLVIERRVPRWAVQLFPLVLLFVFVFAVGLRGLDFPRHPDEPANLQSVQLAFRTKLLLPDNYIYPTMFHWLQVGSALPEVVFTATEFRAEKGLWSALVDTVEGVHDDTLLARLTDDSFVLRTRLVFFVVSSLAVVWVYLAMLAWQKSAPLALVAAGVFGLSWEVSTHMRWIAPDAVMTQFGALSLLFTVLAIVRPCPERWLNYAALAAGLTAGTKYPGGLVLIGVWAAAWIARERSLSRPAMLGHFLRRLVRLGAIFGLTFLFVTPGVILQPAMFIGDLRTLFEHYGEGHRGYSVNAGLDHLARNIEYLSLILWSRWEGLALAATVLVGLGTWYVLRHDRRLTGPLLLTPLAYLILISFERVFFVRNLLILSPFLAILAAAGLAHLWRQLRPSALRALPAVGLAAFLTANGAEMVRTANTVADFNARGELPALEDLASYIADHADTQFLVSHSIYNNLLALKGSVPENVKTQGVWKTFDRVLWERRTDRLLPIWGYPAPRRGLVTAVFGPEYYNEDYYPGRHGLVYLALEPEVFQEFGYQNGVFGRRFSTIEYPDKNQVAYTRYTSLWVPEYVLRQPAGATISWAPTFFQADRITLRTTVRLERLVASTVTARIVVQEGDVFTTLWEKPVVSEKPEPVQLDLTRYGGIPIRLYFEVRADSPFEFGSPVLWAAPDLEYE
jgi:hypothetical protein